MFTQCALQVSFNNRNGMRTSGGYKGGGGGEVCCLIKIDFNGLLLHAACGLSGCC